MMYQMGNVVKYNPMKVIFHQFALHDQIAFEAMLSLSAKHLASVNGKTDTEQYLYHKTRAIALMNARMQDGKNVNRDATLYGAATLAVLEVYTLYLLQLIKPTWKRERSELTGDSIRNGPKILKLKECITTD